MPTHIARSLKMLGLLVLSSPVMWSYAQGPSQSTMPSPVAFDQEIRPILEQKCLSCHGGALQLSRLDLRTRESALNGGVRGPALLPGNAEQSRLYRMVAGLDAPAMPMQGTPLSAAEIATLKKWVDEGAKWGVAETTPVASAVALAALENRPLTSEEREYWAFKLPVQAPVPVVDRKDLTNPIDRFLEKARKERGLTGAPRADRQTLVRRAYLDLLGLPPSPSEVAEFMVDTRPGAWDRLLDKLLASPQYGERYGRHWLDVARYADSAGFEYDVHRPNAWRYRDYVIRSFNADKPYNIFLIEQIAGDEMDGKTEASLIATGFLRAGPRVLFREKDNPERRYDYLDEILGTIGKGTLGLTVNCARCHDHKFDPIRQKDYYALEASIFGYVETEVPLAPPAEAEAYQAKNDDINARRDELRKLINAIEKPHRDRLELEQIKSRFSDAIYQAAAKPEDERTPGEKLLAIQVFEAVNVPGAQIDTALTPDELASKRDLAARIAALEKERPTPLPVAEIATDGDYRFSPLGEGR